MAVDLKSKILNIGPLNFLVNHLRLITLFKLDAVPVISLVALRTALEGQIWYYFKRVYK